MLLHQFPDLAWLKRQAEQNFADRQGWAGRELPHEGWPNVVLQVSAGETCRDNIRGPLSLFMNLSGESVVTTGKRRVTVPEDFFFVTNPDQYYTLEIDRRHTAKTFNIHFGDYFADQVLRAFSSPEAHLLDHPFECPHERLEFHNRLHHRSAALNRVVAEISQAFEPPSLWLEEKLAEVVCLLLSEEKKLLSLRAGLPVLKSSTRAEILRRLLQVTDYIHTHLDKDISLEQLSRIACLSKFHFLRLFKVAFQATPYQFINNERIRRAKKMMQHTRLEVQDIARTLGYENASAFSRMFFKQVGVYPTQLRG
jgi:AraC family transcriptional regulator